MLLKEYIEVFLETNNTNDKDSFQNILDMEILKRKKLELQKLQKKDNLNNSDENKENDIEKISNMLNYTVNLPRNLVFLSTPPKKRN